MSESQKNISDIGIRESLGGRDTALVGKDTLVFGARWA